MLERTELLELADANLVEATREMARLHADSQIEEQADSLLVAGPDPFPIGYVNATLATCPGAPPDPQGCVAAADAFFSARERGYTLWTRDHCDAALAGAAEAADLRAVSDMPGMVLDAPIADASPADDARLVRVDDADGLRDFAAVSARAYAPIGFPPAVVAKIFGQPERGLRPHWINVVAYAGEEPLSAAMAILSHGIAGIYWVGTAPEGRKRGLGDACTRCVGNTAFELGARAVVLQASQQGEPIYLRMGYREITRYRWWLRTPRPPA